MTKKQETKKSKEVKSNTKKERIRETKCIKIKVKKDRKSNFNKKKTLKEDSKSNEKVMEHVQVNEEVVQSEVLPIEKVYSKNNKSCLVHKGCVLDAEVVKQFKFSEIVEDKLARFNGQGFDVTLNYTDIKKNSNKFYKMQVIQVSSNTKEYSIQEYTTKKEEIEKNTRLNPRQKTNMLNELNKNFEISDKEKYYVFFKWGRVGLKGMFNFFYCEDKEKAIHLFLSKFNSKTTHGYKFIPIKFEDSKVNEIKHNEENFPSINNEVDLNLINNGVSTINPYVKNFLMLIMNIKVIDEYIREINYDAEKVPLGCLSKDSIDKGYSILQRIESLLTNIYKIDNDLVNATKREVSNQIRKRLTQARSELFSLSSEFFTYIPHNFGFSNVLNYVIDSMETLEKEVNLLQSLQEIQISSKIIDKVKNSSFSLEKDVDNSLLDYLSGLPYNLNVVDKEVS